MTVDMLDICTDAQPKPVSKRFELTDVEERREQDVVEGLEFWADILEIFSFHVWVGPYTE